MQAIRHFWRSVFRSKASRHAIQLAAASTACAGTAYAGAGLYREGQSLLANIPPKPCLAECLLASKNRFSCPELSNNPASTSHDMCCGSKCLGNLDCSSSVMIESKQFVQAVRQCFDDTSYGVYVVWAPPGAGKTTCTDRVAEAWCKETRDNYCRKIDCYEDFDMPNDMLVKVLHVADASDLAEQLSKTSVSTQLVVVLDQFDDAFRKFERNQLESFVVGLAQASQYSKNYRVIINVSDVAVADVVLGWNSGEKLLLCGEVPRGTAQRIMHFKLNEDEASLLLTHTKPEYTEEDRKLFVQGACKSSNMLTIQLIIQSLKRTPMLVHSLEMQHRIDADAAAWVAGVNQLSTRRERQLHALKQRYKSYKSYQSYKS